MNNQTENNTIFVHTGSNIANAIIYSTLADSRTLGVHWPVDAEFCIVQEYSTWPQGWDREVRVTFYCNEDELKKRLRETAEFFMLEDNDYARRVYRWDLGPEEISMLARNADRIPTGSEAPNGGYPRISCGELHEVNRKLNENMRVHQQLSWPRRMKKDAYDAFHTIAFESESLESIAAKLSTLK